MRALVFASVLASIAALAGCAGSGPAGTIPLVRLSTSSVWSPALPRSASTPVEIAQAIASRAGFSKPVAVRGFHTASGVGLAISFPFHHGVDGSPRSVVSVLYANWEAELIDEVIGGAFAERGIRLNVNRVQISGLLADGTTESFGTGAQIRKGRDTAHPSGAALKHGLTAVLRDAQLTPVSITVLHVGLPAPAVVVKTDHPDARELVSQSVMRTLFSEGGLEGYYIEVVSTTGEPLAAVWRTGDGAAEGWSNPSP
jgi:hypothetical protein